MTELKALKLLFTIVPRDKKSLFLDIISDYEVNYQLVFNGRGTSNSEVMNYLGLEENDKAIIVSFIREDEVKDCLLALEDKMAKGKSYQGVSFFVPLESIIGTNNYLFLANMKRSEKNGK